jgi:hypothetical protein
MIKESPHITLSGARFSPSKFENEAGISFSTKHEKGDISPNLGKEYDFGYGQLEAPDVLNNSEKIEWLLDLILPHINLLESMGVEEKVLHIDVGYNSQCNIEYRPEVIKKLHKFGGHLTLSCFEDDEI